MQERSNTPSNASASPTALRLRSVGEIIRSNPGQIDEAKVHQMCEQNREVLTTFGISERDVMQRLSEGKRVVLSPTSFIDPNDETLFKKSNRPKRFGIVCDTNNARSMLPLLSKTDLLIHEATIAPLQQELRSDRSSY